ncbi:reverse transcriptase [Gossypium australe]|uniref:Reverse transcriptase n=1 Tax=Gossypium australe TaxID=47621 RepID=A0A5B6VE71_9ROSI|nr:reverse transcriptase [Gossypium australe]
MAIRDFNAILSSNEKTCDLSSSKRCPLFGEFVDLANLHDLGFRGPPFTWYRGNLFKRLDCAMGNKAWIIYFPNSLIIHISKIKFDHRPILLNLNSDFALPRGRPFQLLAGWVEHPDFGDLVKDWWDFQGNMSIFLAKFTANLKDWNKTTYGHITSHKMNLMHKLLALQKQMDLSVGGEGRNIIDNIIITQEVIHSMKSCKSKKWMAIKIDLEKAYDRVRWDFIDTSLQAEDIPSYPRNVIVSAISNSTMQILWNGVPTSKFRSKYGLNGSLPIRIAKAMSSFLWKSLSKVWTFLCENLIWSVGDGNKILCWKDKWIPNVGPLINYLPACGNVNTDYLLNDLGTREANWNLNFLQVWLLEEIITRIMGIPSPHPTERHNRLSLRHTSTRAFSIENAYKLLNEYFWSSRNELWKRVWKIFGLQKVCFFFWTVLKQKLLTNVERVRRCLAVDSSCSICGRDFEDILHIIRDCTVAMEVWKQEEQLLEELYEMVLVIG